MTKKIKRLLIANRGEIALRILRACKELSIETIAIHSQADENAMHVHLADEAICIGPPSATLSYLNKAAILTAATLTGADAIHPGFGFLSENADFAEIVTEHGFIWIGPSPHHIRMMGDKITAKKTAKELGIPCVPGSDNLLTDLEDALNIAQSIHYPVILKATSGGGGKGMKVAHNPQDLKDAWVTCRAEAQASFGNTGVYMEKFLTHPRHIEIQIFGDQHGNAVHLGERECSVQRRHQKLLEEAPSSCLTPQERHEIGEISANAIRKIGYYGAGTFEYLYENGKFYFIEMNTRIQVEHPVTEYVYRVDLIKEQIHVAEGKELSFQQKNLKIYGHAIECRINAEDPETFTPSPGTITLYHPPGGPGIRIDSAIYMNSKISPYYDSMIAKLIVHGDTRESCIARLKHALEEFVIQGVKTTLPVHEIIVNQKDFLEGNFSIHWLENLIQGLHSSAKDKK